MVSLEQAKELIKLARDSINNNFSLVKKGASKAITNEFSEQRGAFGEGEGEFRPRDVEGGETLEDFLKAKQAAGIGDITLQKIKDQGLACVENEKEEGP